MAGEHHQTQALLPTWMKEEVLSNTSPAEMQTEDIDFPALLENYISYLLDHELEKLWWILYRIDVPEEAVKSVFAQAIEVNVPHLLTKLILQRLQQKQERKSHHSSPKPTENSDDLLL